MKIHAVLVMSRRAESPLLREQNLSFRSDPGLFHLQIAVKRAKPVVARNSDNVKPYAKGDVAA
jgi:hypothetical protein